MNLQSLSQMLIRYQKYCSMTDPVRFASTALHQDPLPELYAMDPSMFTKSPAERAASIIEKADASDLLTALLAGRQVDDATMRAVLGVSFEELMNYMAQRNPLKKPIPDKTVVVTFDDAKKDHVTHVAPLFRELGFGATFFVTEMEPSPRNGGFADKNIFMTWDEIRQLHDQGFDVGNHSHHHRRPASPLDAKDFAQELNGLNDVMERNGIPRAVSVAYPFGMTDRDQVAVAGACGFCWGRGNLPNGITGCQGKSLYAPLADHPLNIPSYGDAPLYTYERLRERIESAKDGRILCLAYHSVLDPDEWTNTITFEEHFRFMAEQGCHVISMAQLADYIDPVKAAAYTAE